jgi:ribosomal protein S18 acetylase RimI-like enzyme
MKHHVIEAPIPVDIYRQLRVGSGLSAKSAEAAEAGLKNTLYSVLVKSHETPIGMGRLIGDGGTACQVVDVCVLPEYQGQGVGKMIMSHIMHYITHSLPETCYVSLIADGDAKYMYEKFGFLLTEPKSAGMYYEVNHEETIGKETL